MRRARTEAVIHPETGKGRELEHPHPDDHDDVWPETGRRLWRANGEAVYNDWRLGLLNL